MSGGGEGHPGERPKTASGGGDPFQYVRSPSRREMLTRGTQVLSELGKGKAEAGLLGQRMV